MNKALPILLLAGGALLVFGGKKKKEEDTPEIDIPPLPDDIPDPGSSAYEVVDEGIARNYAGVFPWRIILGEEGYIARLYPQGFRGPYDDMYVEGTSSNAKKRIMLWIKNKERKAKGLPPILEASISSIKSN